MCSQSIRIFCGYKSRYNHFEYPLITCRIGHFFAMKFVRNVRITVRVGVLPQSVEGCCQFRSICWLLHCRQEKKERFGRVCNIRGSCRETNRAVNLSKGNACTPRLWSEISWGAFNSTAQWLVVATRSLCLQPFFSPLYFHLSRLLCTWDGFGFLQFDCAFFCHISTGRIPRCSDI